MLERFAGEDGMSEPMRPEPARGDDLSAVCALLRSTGLPTAGVEADFPRGYVVIRRNAALLGAAGLEVHGRIGLLRSVAVDPSVQRTGLGRLLVEDRLRTARDGALEAVYLLTTTAPEYFRRLGFRDTARRDAPAELQSSAEFASICPASAVCLKKDPRDPRPLAGVDVVTSGGNEPI